MKKFLTLLLLTGAFAPLSSLYASKQAPAPSSTTPAPRSPAPVVKPALSNSTMVSSSLSLSKLADTEREQFFVHAFVPVLSHHDIDTALSNSFRQLLVVNETSTQLLQQSAEKGTTPNPQTQTALKTARDNYKKYLLTKAKTIYPLPEAFLEGYLVSPKQILQSLKEVGADPRRVDKEKFWIYCMRCLEMPDPHLDIATEENIITPYLAHLNQLKSRYDKRIREDAFFLTTFTASHLRGNIFSPPLSSVASSPLSSLSQSFLHPSGDLPKTIPQELHVIPIVAGHRYSTTGLQPIMEAIQLLDPADSLERICRGLQADMNSETKVGAKSWRSPDEVMMPVRVAEKLHRTPAADLRPEIIELVDALLARQFNKLVLEKIEKNFERARAPRARGFDSGLPDDIF